MNRLASVFWNRDERRLRALWRLILQAVIFSALLFALALAIRGMPKRLSNERLIEAVASLLIILSVWLGARLLDRRRMTDFGLRIDRAWLIDCAVGMAIGLFLMGLIAGAGLAAGWFELRWSDESAGRLALVLLAGLLEFSMVSLREELFSRGYHLRNIAEGFRVGSIGPRAAVVTSLVITSVIFCAMHVPGVHTPPLALLGLLLGGVLLATGFVFTGRLGLSLGLHLTWNLAQGQVFGFAVSGQNTDASIFSAVDCGPPLWTGGKFGPEGGLLGTIAVLIGIVLTLAWIRVKYGELRLDTSLAKYSRSGATSQTDSEMTSQDLLN